METRQAPRRRDRRLALLVGGLVALAAGAGWLGGCDEEDYQPPLSPTGHPDLDLAMIVDLQGNRSAHELATIAFVLTVWNFGDGAAAGVVIADTLPDAVALEFASAGRGSYDPATGLWTLGTLAADSSTTLTLTVTVQEGTRGEIVTNRARVVAVEPPDSRGDNDDATASFTVLNAPPVAAPDGYTVAEGGTLPVAAPGILGNDSDLEGEAFTLQLPPLIDTRFGTLTLHDDGSFVYVHGGSEEFEDSFRYVIVDASAEADTGLVTITVTPVNDQPVLQPIPSQTIAEGQSFPLLALDDYVSDADDPDATLDWEAIGANALTVVIDAAHRAAVTPPDADWSGQETITFRVTDPGGLHAQRPVTFTATPVNDPPVVGNIPNQSTEAGGSFFAIALDDWVSDVDDADDELLWTYSGNGALEVTINANRVATVTPPSPGWTGQVTIVFRATDPGGLWDEDPATFAVTPAP